MTTSHSMSLRVAALAGSLALAAGAFVAPAVTAADTPDGTIREFAAAFEAKDVEALPGFFCEEQAENLGGIGLASMLADFPAFLDVNLLLDGIVVDLEFESVTVTSQTATEATVDVVGTMASDIDLAALEPFIVTLLGFMDEEATPENIAAATAEMAASIPPAQVTDISGEIRLIFDETAGWLICSPLPGGDVIDQMPDGADDGTTDGDVSGAATGDDGSGADDTSGGAEDDTSASGMDDAASDGDEMVAGEEEDDGE